MSGSAEKIADEKECACPPEDKNTQSGQRLNQLELTNQSLQNNERSVVGTNKFQKSNNIQDGGGNDDENCSCVINDAQANSQAQVKPGSGQQRVGSGPQGFISGQQGVGSGPQGFVSGQQRVYSGPQGAISGPQGFISGQQGFISGQQPVDCGPQGFISGQQGLISGQQGFGSGQQGFISGQQGVDCGPQGFISGQQGFISGQQGVGCGQQGVGIGQQGFISGPQGNISGPQGFISGQQGVGSGPQGFVSGQPGVGSGPQGFISGQQGVGSGPQGFISGPQGFISGQQGFISGQQGGPTGQSERQSGEEEHCTCPFRDKLLEMKGSIKKTLKNSQEGVDLKQIGGSTEEMSRMLDQISSMKDQPGITGRKRQEIQSKENLPIQRGRKDVSEKKLHSDSCECCECFEDAIDSVSGHWDAKGSAGRNQWDTGANAEMRGKKKYQLNDDRNELKGAEEIRDDRNEFNQFTKKARGKGDNMLVDVDNCECVEGGKENDPELKNKFGTGGKNQLKENQEIIESRSKMGTRSTKELEENKEFTEGGRNKLGQSAEQQQTKCCLFIANNCACIVAQQSSATKGRGRRNGGVDDVSDSDLQGDSAGGSKLRGGPRQGDQSGQCGAVCATGKGKVDDVSDSDLQRSTRYKSGAKEGAGGRKGNVDDLYDSDLQRGTAAGSKLKGGLREGPQQGGKSSRCGGVCATGIEKTIPSDNCKNKNCNCCAPCNCK